MHDACKSRKPIERLNGGQNAAFRTFLQLQGLDLCQDEEDC